MGDTATNRRRSKRPGECIRQRASPSSSLPAVRFDAHPRSHATSEAGTRLRGRLMPAADGTGGYLESGLSTEYGVCGERFYPFREGEGSGKRRR